MIPLLRDAMQRRHRLRGQALVEMALVTPIMILLIVGGLMLGLAMFDRQSKTWEAQEAAYAAATTKLPALACADALAAAMAVSGRTYIACDGSDGLTMTCAPVAVPPTVTIALDGGTYPIPFGDAVTVGAEATAIIRSPPKGNDIAVWQLQCHGPAA